MSSTLHYFDAPNPQNIPGTHRIAYREWGDPNNRRAVVCVHGLTRNSRDFDFLAETLYRDYRVICIDIPGRGESEWLKNPGWYHYGVYFEDCLALLDHLGIARCRWVGTSMGGIIGMMIASLRPERISKLAINDIGAHIPKAGLDRIVDYVGVRMEFASCAEAETYLREVFAPWGIVEEKHWQHLLRYSLTEEAPFRLRYDPAIAEAFRSKEPPYSKEQADVNLLPVWEKVNCPVLLLHGLESDILLHETALRMVTGKPDVRLVEFSGIGHAPSLMTEGHITLVQEWLAAK